MRNKELVLQRIEQVRQDVRALNYLLRTNASFDEIQQSFEKINERIEQAESLVSIEPDTFKSNQLV